MSTEVLEAPVETTQSELGSIVFLNRTGDITLTWDERNDEKIKELVRKKMAEGYQFFTMRKVVIDAIQVKRKVGLKGIDTIKSLIIEDDVFEKLVEGLDDKDVATLVHQGDAGLAKIRKENGKKPVFDALARAKTPEDVIKSKSAMALRKVVGG